VEEEHAADADSRTNSAAPPSLISPTGLCEWRLGFELYALQDARRERIEIEVIGRDEQTDVVVGAVTQSERARQGFSCASRHRCGWFFTELRSWRRRRENPARSAISLTVVEGTF